jgi:hypothetical protein
MFSSTNNFFTKLRESIDSMSVNKLMKNKGYIFYMDVAIFSLHSYVHNSFGIP